MKDVVIRPLVAGEESLFDSMPEPFPELRQVRYADGVAAGGYRPENTWVALRRGELVARAAWLLPPGAVGEPWLERFDLIAEAEVGAALLRSAHESFGGAKDYYASLPPDWRDRPEVPSMKAARRAGLRQGKERLRYAWTGESVENPKGRFEFRPAMDAREINALVQRIKEPEMLTGAETARLVRGVDLASRPLDWLSGPPQAWRIALKNGIPVGLAAAAGDACYPMIAYLGLLDEAARGELLNDAVRELAEAGAREIVVDVDAERQVAQEVLQRQGFKPIRARVHFMAGSVM
jgi:hypothetical protein